MENKKMLMRVILHTAGKSDEEILKDAGEVTEKDLPWMREVDAAWDGAEVYVSEEGGTYVLAGWDQKNKAKDEKVKKAIWTMEKHPVFGTYDSWYDFCDDWDNKEYYPSGTVRFQPEEVEIIERGIERGGEE